MRTTLSILAFVLCLTINAQTVIQGNLIIDSNITIGQNCGGNNETITYTGDLNFNGDYTLTLKGVNLIIQGNINGTGTIDNHCNSNVSDICGGLQNSGNINFSGVTICGDSLSSSFFNIEKDLGLYYTIYNLAGQKIKEGITTADMFYDVPREMFMILKVEGFEAEKIMIQ